MRAREEGEEICLLCLGEIQRLQNEEYFDHYFWGIDASNGEEEMYFIRIYQECEDFKWLLGKRIRIDLDDKKKQIKGTVQSAETVKKPPYRSGDVVAVKLIEMVTRK